MAISWKKETISTVRTRFVLDMAGRNANHTEVMELIHNVRGYVAARDKSVYDDSIFMGVTDDGQIYAEVDGAIYSPTPPSAPTSPENNLEYVAYRPEKVEAMQWDGSEESASAISKWVGECLDEDSLDFEVMPNQLRVQFCFNSTGSTHSVARNGWVVIDDDGDIKEMSNEEFTRTYEKARKSL